MVKCSSIAPIICLRQLLRKSLASWAGTSPPFIILYCFCLVFETPPLLPDPIFMLLTIAPLGEKCYQFFL